MDSLVGVFFTFMLGFSMNFVSMRPSVRARRMIFWSGALLLLALMQWQLTLNEAYWTGHWILVVWPPMVALSIAMLVYSLREPTWEWQWLGSQGPCVAWSCQLRYLLVALSGDADTGLALA
jgi:hypothetical protein